MRCPACGSTAIRERPERTAQGYRRFCCRRKTSEWRTDWPQIGVDRRWVANEISGLHISAAMIRGRLAVSSTKRPKRSPRKRRNIELPPRKFALLAIALASALFVMGCATAPAPLASHGMDDTPAFDASYYGNVGIERGFLSGPCREC
jgi:hypothetical protein